MSLAPGTRLGTYEVLAPLGTGGMGQVYRALDIRLEREVAVKLLPEALGASPERLAQLEREARTLAGLNHPNIVTLFSVEDEDGLRFLTMELVEGSTLEALVVPGGLPLSRLLELAIPLAEALVAAHARGIVHRDLKPGNLMLTPEGRLKVLDFGLADRAALAGPDESTLAAGPTGDAPVSPFAGTLPYMAPEQLRGEPAAPASDLFAVGVLLFELATGRRPFTSATLPELSSAILRDDPFAAGAAAALPPALVPLLRRCLAKSAAERWPDAVALRAALGALRSGDGAATLGAAAPVEAVSIAVLPFVNRSRDEEHEYFSDGLADELLDMLAKIRGLRVAARSSSFQFRGTQAGSAAIGRQLNVATLLEGSVRRAGNRARISVQLVKVADG
jgi:serine/threonine protein kinase